LRSLEGVIAHPWCAWEQEAEAALRRQMEDFVRTYWTIPDDGRRRQARRYVHFKDDGLGVAQGCQVLKRLNLNRFDNPKWSPELTSDTKFHPVFLLATTTLECPHSSAL
jgi:hypothetical protein